MPVRQYREPITKSAAGVTLEAIYRELALVAPELAGAELDRAVLLFAMLKCGKSIEKLMLFTKWPAEEIRELMATIKDPSLVYGSTVSTRYVLRHVPGSEDLIEAITGERVVAEEKPLAAAAPHAWEKNLVRPAISKTVRVAPRPVVDRAPKIEPAPVSAVGNGIPQNNPTEKERPMNTESAVNGATDAADVQPTCLKTPGCPRPAGHNGLCKGQKNPRGLKRRAAAVKAKPSRKARRRTQAIEFTPATATEAKAESGSIEIRYKDGDQEFFHKGFGRENCLKALDAAQRALTGGSNG